MKSLRRINYENLKKVNEVFSCELKRAFASTLESGWFILGRELEDFEKNFSKYHRDDCETVGVASGLDALTLSLSCLDLPLGSEVIVPANTYIATILAIKRNGLTPVLVEPDIRTYNIDPNKIKEKITNLTRVIMVVHLYGQSCEMGFITDLCNKYKLYLIEDCAQAHGASFNGQKVGTFGNFGAFSFYPTKNLGALGDGGGILTSNKEYSKKLKSLRNYGSDIKYHNKYVGYNSRLDELQAAFLNIKLRSLDNINSHKRKLASIYDKGLNNTFIKPYCIDAAVHVYHIYPIRHEKRDLLREYLLKQGIITEVHYPVAPYKQECFIGEFDESSYPLTDEIHETILSLPISYSTTEEDVYHIVEIMNDYK